MILKTVFTKLFKIREEAARNRAESAPGADDGFDPHEKPFLDHLEDLRKTLMQMVFTLLIVTIGSFVFNQQIFEFVHWPLKSNGAMIDEEAGTTLWDVANFITLSPQELFMLAIKTSFITGLILAFPVLVYQAFQFILPGLRQVEKRLIIPGALVGFVLFLVGASFAFFVATPIALKFFYQFEQSRIGAIDPMSDEMAKPIGQYSLIDLDGNPVAPLKPKVAGEGPKEEPIPENPLGPKVETPPVVESTLDDKTKAEIRQYMFQLLAFKEGSEIAMRYDESRDKIVLFKVKGKMTQYRIGDYISFLTRLVLVFGISFQLPVVVTILVKLELLTAQTMRATRSYAWIIMMVASAIFTPPDVITLGLLAGPLIVLYEICIVIASAIERNRAKREQAEEDARKSRLAKLYERKAEDLSEEEKEELHRHEIEQYEKEHAHLYDHENDPHHGEHDADHDGHYDDPYHNDPYHDEHGNPIDHDEYGHPIEHQDHDESWKDDHENDPHHGEEPHEPIQDWPDREDEEGADGKDKKVDPAPLLESDHAEPTAEGHESGDSESEPETTDDDQPNDYDEEDYDDEVCAPSGPIVDLNTADFDEIMDLPGMDEELAQMLIDHRPYESFDEVEEVPGMSPEKLNEMIERLMLG